jgi:Flp pilus assembly protein TadG
MASARESGSAALEVVLLTPIFLLLLAFVVGLGRLGSAAGEVTAAARDAARAASIERSAGAASAAARDAALESLRGHDLTCDDPSVETDVTDFRPGGTVVVALACRVGLDDVVAAGFPGTRVLRARVTASIDRYRGVSS